MKEKLVRDIMLISPATVSPEATLGEAGRLIVESGQRTLPVVTAEGEICGVVSDRDIRLAADSPLLDEAPAEIFETL